MDSLNASLQNVSWFHLFLWKSGFVMFFKILYCRSKGGGYSYPCFRCFRGRVKYPLTNRSIKKGRGIWKLRWPTVVFHLSANTQVLLRPHDRVKENGVAKIQTFAAFLGFLLTWLQWLLDEKLLQLFSFCSSVFVCLIKGYTSFMVSSHFWISLDMSC